MARNRRSQADATAKWQARVAQSGQYYQQGIQSAQGWAANAQAAAPRRNAGLQAAIADGRIDRGIARAGDAKWREATLAKGVSAWTANTPKAAAAFAAGIQRTYGFFSQADQAVANIDTSTVQGRIQKAAVFLQAVHSAAQQHKAGG